MFSPIRIPELYTDEGMIHTLHVALPSPLEKVADHKNLQSRHSHHHSALDHAQIEDSTFRTPHRAEVPVLPRPEVFLVAIDCR